MALSRIALAVPIALYAAPALGQIAPVDEALERQREIVRSAVSPECGSTNAEEIVVCGRREEEEEARRYRVPPSSAYSGPAETAGGEQLEAMAAGSERCSTVGRSQRCSGGLNVIAAGMIIFRTIQAIRARRD